MNTLNSLLTAALIGLALAAGDADAKRMGAGRSIGAQRDSVTAQTTPSAASAAAPAASTPSATAGGVGAAAATTSAAGTAAKAAAAPASGASRWLGPIAGLAAGIGLAALFGTTGGGVVLLLLLTGLLIFAGWAMARRFARHPAPATITPADNVAYGAPQGFRSPAGYETQPTPEPAMRTGDYSHEAQGIRQFRPQATSRAQLIQATAIPDGFDVDNFLRVAREQFVRLQGAFDGGDLETLDEVLTPDMLEEVRTQIATRGNHVPTEIISLHSELIELVAEGSQGAASVRFRGSLREDGRDEPENFDEVWNLTKPLNGRSGWLLAGIQQLH